MLIAYTTIKEVKPRLSSTEERAMAEYRGFHEVAQVMTKSIQHPLVLDVCLEVIENLRQNLLQKRSQVM